MSIYLWSGRNHSWAVENSSGSDFRFESVILESVCFGKCLMLLFIVEGSEKKTGHHPTIPEGTIWKKKNSKKLKAG